MLNTLYKYLKNIKYFSNIFFHYTLPVILSSQFHISFCVLLDIISPACLIIVTFATTLLFLMHGRAQEHCVRIRRF